MNSDDEIPNWDELPWKELLKGGGGGVRDQLQITTAQLQE